MNEAELIVVARREAVEKAQRLPPMPAGSEYSVNQNEQTFQIIDANGVVLAQAKPVMLGTCSSRTRTWLWADRNTSIERVMCERLDDVRRFGKEHGVDVFIRGRIFDVDFQRAEEIFVCAVHILNADGWFRYQVTPTSWVHLALFDIERFD